VARALGKGGIAYNISSYDGLVSVIWRLEMAVAYLPNIKANLIRVMHATGGFHLGAHYTLIIILEGVSGDVLAKINKYMRLFHGRASPRKSFFKWNLSFFLGLPAHMLIKLNVVSKPILAL
jgi:hypothetical protein